ncbi:MAG: metal ABC transporter permease [Actinomycetaceae bacterium]|nr:metal ABC transporter permease [Actinomycetaceae bacterium]
MTLSTWTELLTSPFMIRSLLVAICVGGSAPVIGTYLIQRRLALMGDGIGHVALTGVALGWLVGNAMNIAPDQLAVPGAIITSIIGAIFIEELREKSHTSRDIALALLFYGGIATGVLIIGLAGGTTANLTSYLFGSLASVSWQDVVIAALLALLIAAVGLGLYPALFSITYDDDFARSTGLPVGRLNYLIAVTAALTVATAMRVVGVLLVSAIMIVPVVIAQLYARSFYSTMLFGMFNGTILCVSGLIISYFHPVSPGATIVVTAIVVLIIGTVIAQLMQRNTLHKSSTNHA